MDLYGLQHAPDTPGLDCPACLGWIWRGCGAGCVGHAHPRPPAPGVASGNGGPYRPPVL